MRNFLKGFLPLMALLCSFSAGAQILKPVTWSFAAKTTGKNKVTLFFKATIEEGWHIYSQNIKEGGPVKTTFTFNRSAAYSVSGPTAEPQPVSKFEKAFGMNVTYFERTVIFRQQVNTKGKAVITGQIEFMTCNDKQCLPPETVDFTIPVK